MVVFAFLVLKLLLLFLLKMLLLFICCLLLKLLEGVGRGLKGLEEEVVVEDVAEDVVVVCLFVCC